MNRTVHAVAAVAILIVAAPLAWNVAREREAEHIVSKPETMPSANVAPVAPLPSTSLAAKRPRPESPAAPPPAAPTPRHYSEELPPRPKTIDQAFGAPHVGYGFDASGSRGNTDLTAPTRPPDAARRETPLHGSPPSAGTALDSPMRNAVRGADRFSAPRPLPPNPSTIRAENRQDPAEPAGRDSFAEMRENGFKVVREAPVSTFSIDVDTASYSFLRASLNRNVLPQKAAVRTEELINYFPYAYDGPASATEPFAMTSAVYPSPWATGRKIVQIGIKGYAVEATTRPAANLVFLIDTSGSMNGPNRLPLVKQSLSLLLTQLNARDRVAIVVYAGSAGTVLDSTPADQTTKILGAIESLGAGGGTAGGEGIRQAYALAGRGFDPKAVNRVILATDGDFNLGITDREELKGFVERERSKGIFLSVLGFGMGNYGDALMQALAQNGNGVAAYIDTFGEARKVLVEEATSALVPIAKDVKIQVEFNPATVSEYRLIGYESRRLAREDFSNDRVDAGDVGSGQSVTVLYEIVPLGGPRLNGDLRYAEAPLKASPEATSEYAHVAIRYKLPTAETSTLMTTSIDPSRESASFEDAPREARFATAVAAFGELLRGGKYTGGLGFDDVVRMGSAARGEDPFGYRAEFVQLVRAAKSARGLEAP